MKTVGYKITIEIKGEMIDKDNAKIDQGKLKGMVKRHVEKTLGCRCTVKKCDIKYGGNDNEKENAQMEKNEGVQEKL